MKSLPILYLILALLACTQIETQQESLKDETPKVIAIYPSSDTLPENLLRFYIQFLEPMKAVHNLENIKLLDENGKEIKGAIFNNVYELWDSRQQQLTLILDPARIKTGLIAHNNLGRALVPNQHFQLVIEKAENIHGQILKRPFTKDFFVSKADTLPPNVDNWAIKTPPSNSQHPLQITFPQPLDRLSLLTRIRLLDANSQMIKGKININNQEKQWAFFPNKNWQKGTYTLQINSRLEDPSGNNLNGLFDHEVDGLRSKWEEEIIERQLFIM